MISPPDGLGTRKRKCQFLFRGGEAPVERSNESVSQIFSRQDDPPREGCGGQDHRARGASGTAAASLAPHRAPVADKRKASISASASTMCASTTRASTFFSGAVGLEVARFQKEAMTGHRPNMEDGRQQLPVARSRRISRRPGRGAPVNKQPRATLQHVRPIRMNPPRQRRGCRKPRLETLTDAAGNRHGHQDPPRLNWSTPSP